MMVELVCEKDCPNVARTRANLLGAFVEAGIPAKWTEWDRSDADAPAHVRGFGSPRVLIDGRDVITAQALEGGVRCRFYETANGHFTGIPPVELIVKAFKKGMSNCMAATNAAVNNQTSRWKHTFWILPGISVSLLPKLACPVCWPAYIAVLSAIGMGFLASTAYLVPLMVGFLIVALGSLGYRADRGRGYGPFLLGLIASGLVLSGKFILISEVTLYRIALLVGASMWNTWPQRKGIGSCPACVPAESLTKIETNKLEERK